MNSCCLVRELVEVFRAPENGVECVGIKLDDRNLDVGIICKCVLPVQLPVLFRKVRTPSIPGNNIYDTFTTGTGPDTTGQTRRSWNLLFGIVSLAYVEPASLKTNMKIVIKNLY
jgi:hypothetical protein